jgi:hypothetical protein
MAPLSTRCWLRDTVISGSASNWSIKDMQDSLSQHLRKNYLSWFSVFFLWLAAFLRILLMTREPLWDDEVFTLWVARTQTLRQLLTATQGDVHQPTWYIIEWLSVHVFGTNVWALRLPAALFGILTIAVVFRLTVVLKLRLQVGLLATFLVCILPAAILFSQEARPYSMLAFGVCLSTLALLYHRWEWAIFALALTIYSHNLGLIYAATLLAGLFLYEFILNRQARAWLALIFVGVALGLIWLPGMLFIWPQLNQIGTGFWIPSPNLITLLNGLNEVTFGLRAAYPFAAVSWANTIALTLLCFWVLRKQLGHRAWLLLFLMMAIAPMVAVGVSIVWHPIFHARAFLASGIGIVIATVAAIFMLRPFFRLVSLVLLILVAAIGILSYYFPTQFKYGGEDVRAVVEPRWQPGDILYFSSLLDALTFSYYVDKPYRVRPNSDNGRLRLPDPSKEAVGLQQTLPQALPATFQRIWFIQSVDQFTTIEELDIQHELTPCAIFHTELRPPQKWNTTIHIWLINSNCYAAQ